MRQGAWLESGLASGMGGMRAVRDASVTSLVASDKSKTAFSRQAVRKDLRQLKPSVITRSTDGHRDAKAHGEDHHNAEAHEDHHHNAESKIDKRLESTAASIDSKEEELAELQAKQQEELGEVQEELAGLRTKQEELAELRSKQKLEELQGTDIYGKGGWNLKEDFVSTALKPQELQPYYMMPLFFGIKITLTMSIFGFSIRFKEDVVVAKLKDDGFCATCFEHGFFQTMKAQFLPPKVAEDRGKMTCGMKTMFQLGFMAMACNGYLHDFLLYTDVTKDMDGFWKRMCCLAVIVATSANYVAARALRSQVDNENPVKLLHLKPKYRCVPLEMPGGLGGLPLMPGEAKWFSWEKHLYFLLLSPYMIFYMMVTVGLNVAYLGWCCSTKCVMCLQLCTVSWNCYWSLIGTIVSFGLWAWAKESYGYWWPLLVPTFYCSLMQIWSSLVAPVIFSVFYGYVNGLSPDQMAKGFDDIWRQGAGGDQTQMTSPGQMPSLADKEDIQRLIQLNREELKVDFTHVNAPEDDTKEDTTHSLDDTKIKIFYKNMLSISSITAEQMFLITLVRIMFCSGSLEEYIGGYQLTISERHWYL